MKPLTEIKKEVLKEITKGYDISLNELKAESIIDVEELIELVYNKQAQEFEKMIKKRIDYWESISNGTSWYLIIKELKELLKEVQKGDEE